MTSFDWFLLSTILILAALIPVSERVDDEDE